MAKNERSDRYESRDIGTYAGAQGPRNFQSMYPNLNMPQGVMDYRFNPAPSSAMSYNTNMAPSTFEGMGKNLKTRNPNANIPQTALAQQGGMNSMGPQQSMMPDFMQMAMQRYMGNPGNFGGDAFGGGAGIKPPALPRDPNMQYPQGGGNTQMGQDPNQMMQQDDSRLMSLGSPGNIFR